MRARLSPSSPLLLLLAACVPGMTTPTPRPEDRAALRWTIDSLLDLPGTRQARWGVLIVDPDRGDTLYSRDAGKLFVPASNMKIVTAAVALTALGPEFRAQTTLLAGGPVRDGVLDGDLLVVGGGDPGISDHLAGDAMLAMQTLAEGVRARGIRRVVGTVRAVGDAFPDEVLGFGWAWDDLDFPYSAPVDELLFNEGFSEIVVRAADSAGAPPTVATRPARTFPRVRVEAVTFAPDSGDTTGTRLEAVKDTLSGFREVVLRGRIAIGDSALLSVTHRDPGAAFIAALREALAEQGITVGDSTLADSAGASEEPLVVLPSAPLHEVLGVFMKPSQNQIGEMLLKTTALQLTDTGTALVGRRIAGGQLVEWGADSAGFAIFDGSGLSRRNLISPETIVRVLDAMRRGPHFQAYHDAFPVAGVDGTLRSRMRGTVAEANARAKTGTLGNVRSLSGYVTTADGQPLLFSILANNYLVGTDHISRVQDSIVVRLARMRGLRPARPDLAPGAAR